MGNKSKTRAMINTGTEKTKHSTLTYSKGTHYSGKLGEQWEITSLERDPRSDLQSPTTLLTGGKKPGQHN